MEEDSFFDCSVNDEYSNRQPPLSAASKETEKADILNLDSQKLRTTIRSLRPVKDLTLEKKDSIQTLLSPEKSEFSNIRIVQSLESSIEETKVRNNAPERIKHLLSTIKSRNSQELNNQIMVGLDDDRYKYLENLMKSYPPIGKRRQRERTVLIEPAELESDEDSYTINSEHENKYEKAKNDTEENHTNFGLLKSRNVYDSMSISEDSEDEGIPEDIFHILSNSRAEFYFELVMIIGTFVSVLVLPFFLAFEIESTFKLTISCLTDFTHVLQLYYWLNKPILDEEGKLVFQRKLIFKEFMDKHFHRTIISALPTFPALLEVRPFSNLSSKARSYSLLILILIRFVNLFRKDNLFYANKIHRTNLQVDKILKFLICVMIFMIISTNTWVFIGKSGADSDNWISLKAIGTNNDFDIFVAAFFYCVVTTLTIGYGDITPVIYEEYIFSCVFMFLGVGLFSFILSSLSLIFSTDDKSQIKEKIKLVDDINKDFNLPDGLYKQLIAFVKKNKINIQLEKIKFIEKLPINLKRIFIQKTIDFNLNRLDFFGNDNYEFILATVKVIRYGSYSKKDVLYSIGDVVKELNIILKGKVGLKLGESFYNMSLGFMNTGVTVGDVEFYFDEQMDVEVFAITKVVNTLIIRGKDFTALERKFPQFVFNNVLNSLKKQEFFEVRKTLLKKIRRYRCSKEDLQFALYKINEKVTSEAIFDSVHGLSRNKATENLLEDVLSDYEIYFEMKYGKRLYLSREVNLETVNKLNQLNEMRLEEPQNHDSLKSSVLKQNEVVESSLSKKEKLQDLIDRLRIVSNNFVFEMKAKNANNVHTIGLDRQSFFKKNGVIDDNVIDQAENLVENKIEIVNFESCLQNDTFKSSRKENSYASQISRKFSIFSSYEKKD